VTAITPRWSRVHGSGGTVFGVADSRGDATAPTLLATLGFKASVEAFEMQRYCAIADRLSARVIVLETPGFGYSGSGLRWPEWFALARRGDFLPLARRMVVTLRATFSDLPDRLGLIGYSMGCSLGAAIARAMNTAGAGGGAIIDRAVLVEPVALTRWPVRQLAATSGAEDGRVEEYLARNHDWASTLVHPVDRRPSEAQPSRRLLDLMVLANALRQPRIAADLTAAVPLLQRVVVVHGDESLLSARGSHAALFAALRGLGVAVSDVEVPGPHAVWLSVPDVVSMMDRVAGLLRDAG
jgi:Alpha/beta hydrolase family